MHILRALVAREPILEPKGGSFTATMALALLGGSTSTGAGDDGPPSASPGEPVNPDLAEWNADRVQLCAKSGNRVVCR